MQYLVYGSQAAMLDKEVEKIINNILPERDVFNLIRLDATQTPLSEVVTSANTANIFSPKKVIILKKCYFLTAENVKVPFENDIQILENYLLNPLDGTDIIFVVESDKLDERKKITKTVKECSKVTTIAKVSKQDLPKFIRTILERKNLRLDEEAFQEFCNRVGTDILKISNESDKLTLYGQDIDLLAIENLVAAPIEDNVFQLADALIEKKMSRALSIYRDLRLFNVEPISLVNMIARQFRNVYIVLLMAQKKYSIQDIAKFLGIHPYPVQLMIEKNKINKKDKFLEVLYQLAELDISMKISAVDKFTQFECFLVKTCL